MTSKYLIPRRAFLAVTALVAPLCGCRHAEQVAQRPGAQQMFSTSAFQGGRSGPALSNPEKADIQLSVARSLEQQDKIEQAIKAYYRVLALDKREEVYHRLAILHDKQADFEKSEEFYHNALTSDPHNANLLCDRGYSLYLQRRWQEAEKHFRQAIARAPQLARAHNNLGLLLAHTGRNDEALQQFAAAGCKQVEARVNLAFALILADQQDEARRQLELALQADKTLASAQELLASLDRDRQQQDANIARFTEPAPAVAAPQPEPVLAVNEHTIPPPANSVIPAEEPPACTDQYRTQPNAPAARQAVSPIAVSQPKPSSVENSPEPGVDKSLTPAKDSVENLAARLPIGMRLLAPAPVRPRLVSLQDNKLRQETHSAAENPLRRPAYQQKPARP